MGVQVIIQGIGDALMFLVNDAGIIMTIECVNNSMNDYL